ncbi:MAG: mannonate dehydratase [bacterium]|nr:mannonate dehydratase [bacterium]
MKISFSGGDLSEEHLSYARQLGVDGLTCTASVIPGYAQSRVATVDELRALQKQIEAHDLELLTFRFRPQDTYNILCNPADRDREIDQICATLRAAGKVGIPFVYYNLTPWRSLDTAWAHLPSVPALNPGDLSHGSGPGRYHLASGRGKADLLTHTSARASQDAQSVPEIENAPYGRISADELWDRIRYFYERVVPTAEEAGVNVGAHPNDPPEPVYRGVEQIHHTVSGLQKLIDLVPSPRSGLLLCIGTLHEMGEDTMGAIAHFLQQEKVFQVHFRNPTGTVRAGYYQEDFLDEGDLDMHAVMAMLYQYGFKGNIDPDHAVGIAGDRRGRIGFAWELGYIKALRDGVIKGPARPVDAAL